MPKLKPIPEVKIDPELLDIITTMYTKWTGQTVADHIAHFRKLQENQLRIELLKKEITSMQQELDERTAK
jgi:uncharacterized protein (UPF0276 family)